MGIILLFDKKMDRGDCFNFQKHGNCKFGDQCRFSHDGTPGTGGGGGQGRSFGGSMGGGQGKCNNWTNYGNCKFGDQCKFSHDGAPSGGGQEWVVQVVVVVLAVSSLKL